jgi:UDP:flavonoid glycosyltransferase YjiC (YdhE family)
LRIVIPTIGSLGDVQPYVALGLGLQAAGHHVRLATHGDFAPFIRSWGLDFWAIEESARAFHALEAGQKMIGAGANAFVFMRHFARLRQPLMDSLVARTYQACQDADAIVASNSALLIGHAVAEKLGLPILSSCLQPMGISRFQANSLFPPAPSWWPLPGTYNVLTNILVGEVLWQFLRTAVNKARQEVLDLPPFSLLGPVGLFESAPVLHAYSSAVIARPPDWGDLHHMTGYWFLERPPNWQPSRRLVDFLEAGPAPVYVGFGSMNNRNPDEVTDLVVRALRRCGQRGILMMGWGGLGHMPQSDQILAVESGPHDWLFPRMAAVVHHGGAGTTAAGLRAGTPSLVVPFMADQPFWGRRVFELGAGPRPIPRRELTVDRLAETIRAMVNNPDMRLRALAFSRQLRAENGVADAVAVIERRVGAATPRPVHRHLAMVAPHNGHGNGTLRRRTPVPSQA